MLKRIVLVFLALAFIACNGCIESGAISYTFKGVQNVTVNRYVSSRDSLPRFSFEYPVCYSLSDRTEGNLNPALYIYLNAESSDEFFKGILKDIRIEMTNYDPKWLGFADAKTSMNRNISDLKRVLYRNFRILAKRRITVNGIQGWETIVSFRERPFSGIIDMKARLPNFMIARDVYFDYQGVTWVISLYSDKNSYEIQTKNNFELILKTFKFEQ
jgi:hypothetical protein